MNRPRLLLFALTLAACGPAPLRGYLASPGLPEQRSSPTISARPRLLSIEDQRPQEQRRRYPDAPTEFQRAASEHLAPWLEEGNTSEVTLRLTLIHLTEPRPEHPASLAIEASLFRGDTPLWQRRLLASSLAPDPALAFREISAVSLRALQGSLDRVLALGAPALPARPTHASPGVFLVERVSRALDYIETIYIENVSGKILRHEVKPLLDRSEGRPGDWLLSRRTIEGHTLSGAAYEDLVQSLSDRYELRSLDDAYRRHFFGKKREPSPSTP